MPKGVKGKGGKNRRRGKNEGDEKRELIFKEDAGCAGPAHVRERPSGGAVHRRCEALSATRQDVQEGRVNTGDIVLLGLRDYQDEKADVILKYLADEARSLKNSPRAR